MVGKRALLATALAAAFCGAAESRPHDCYWINGRLTLGNGTPAIRLWPSGTNRLLGVSAADNQPESDKALPAKVSAFFRENRTDRIWGSFKVCPLAQDRAGVMRPVTLVAARNLKLRP